MRRNSKLLTVMLASFMIATKGVNASDLTSKMNPSDSLGGVTTFEKSYDRQNDLNEITAKVTLNGSLIERVLNQAPGNANSAASLGSFYFTLNPGLDQEGYTFKKQNVIFDGDIQGAKAAIDQKNVEESAVGYSSVWPINLKIEYFDGSWKKVTNKSNGGKTIKANLAELLGVDASALVYGVNYRFYLDPVTPTMFGWELIKDGSVESKEYVLVSYDVDFPVMAVEDEKVIFYPSVDNVLATGSSNIILTDQVAEELKNVNFFETLDAGEELTLVRLDDAGNLVYAWGFDGNRITDPSIRLNANITFTSEAPEAIRGDVSKLVKDYENVSYLNFEHEGKLPGEAIVMYHVADKYAVGTKLYIAHYNETTKELEEAQEVTVDDNGLVAFSAEECSSYVLYTKAVSVQTPVQEVKNVKTGDMNLVMVISLITAAGAGLVFTGKKIFVK